MKKLLLSLAAVLLVVGCVTTTPTSSSSDRPVATTASSLSFLKVSERTVVDESGQPVHLRGCNNGTWLLIEPWMLGTKPPEEFQCEKAIWDLMAKRFGEEKKLELIRAHRENWFTRDDVRLMTDHNMNCLRIPIWWRATDDPAYAGDIQWLDDCISWCREFGVYAIIDLHGAPGGQSRNKVIVGEPSNSDLWTSKAFQDQTVAWWKKIAERYKDEPAVAGYDLLNEAIDCNVYDLVAFYARLYDEIRAVDPDHILIIEDGLHGFHRLPHPTQMGWSNVMYSFHYYPQEIVEGIEADAVLFQKFNRAAIYYGVPVLVGEFNTVKIQRGGVDTMHRYMTAYDFFGWPWTFWSYKMYEDNWDFNWGLFGFDRERRIDFVNDSAEEILSGFRNMRTHPDSMQPFLATALAHLSDPTPTYIPDDILYLSLKDAFLVPEGGQDLRMDWSSELPSAGYWGNEDRIAWPVQVEQDGLYRFEATIATPNNNVRAHVWVDGVLSHTAKIDTPTGDWNRYELRDLGLLHLTEGRHVVEIAPAPGTTSFINLRNGQLRADDGKPKPMDESRIRLYAVNMNVPAAGSPLRVEWLNDPMAIGYWKPGETVTWTIALQKEHTYRPVLTYATPNTDTVLSLLVDGETKLESKLSSTKDWSAFETVNLNNIVLPAGAHTITVKWDGNNQDGCGNLSEILFREQ